ncbi:hypothetical protein [Planococcus sp. YIM B11945]|uniref:hypothetical protein n=1 Tax=Planococcus sp. YIM B11945 TaxID=3435410 RepID=UPI003D7E9AEA
MARQMVTIESLEDQLFQLKLEKAIQKAYEKGIEDGRSKYYYPPVLKKADLVTILQVEMPTVTKLVANPTFPRLKDVKARYPRDEVFKWIEENTDCLA